MRFYIFIWLTIMSSLLPIGVSATGIEVDDFMHALERIERSYAHYTFEEAFKCGQKAKFQAAKNMCTVTCETRGIFSVCQSLCIPPDINSEFVTEEVINCTEDSVTIFSSDGDIRTITRADFLKFNKNPLRELFSRIPNWYAGVYQVSIMRVRRGEHTLGWKTPQERKVPAWFLEGQIVYRAGDGSESFEDVIFTLIDDETIAWFAQSARMRLTHEGTMWRLDEI